MGRLRTRYGTNDLPRLDVRDARLREAWRARPEAVALTANGATLYITFTPCRFGGRRPWFVCGGCGRRRLALYRSSAGAWACRACLRLVYPSQRASRDLSLTGQLRVEALCRRFDPAWRYGDDWPEKPPRVRWRTWRRFLDAVDFWEACRDAVLVWRWVTTLRDGRTP